MGFEEDKETENLDLIAAESLPLSWVGDASGVGDSLARVMKNWRESERKVMR